MNIVEWEIRHGNAWEIFPEDVRKIIKSALKKDINKIVSFWPNKDLKAVFSKEDYYHIVDDNSNFKAISVIIPRNKSQNFLIKNIKQFSYANIYNIFRHGAVSISTELDTSHGLCEEVNIIIAKKSIIRAALMIGCIFSPLIIISLPFLVSGLIFSMSIYDFVKDKEEE